MASDLQAVLDELQARLAPEKRRTDYLPSILMNLPRIECADGFSMSVQACSLMYCSPRNNDGPWHQVEIGFPSAKVEALMEYAENPDRPTQTVYGWVPIKVVAQIILDHGGFARARAPAA